jgi:WD40 repeat protein
MSKHLENILSVRVDFNFADPCYVLKLASGQHSTVERNVAAALSNNVIKLYRHHVADLQQVGALEGHSDRITDVSIPLQQAPCLVLSSSDDGTVRLWDSRTNYSTETYATAHRRGYVELMLAPCTHTSCSTANRPPCEGYRYRCAGEEVYSCTCCDNVVAAGTNGMLTFWDRRRQQMLQRMSDTHMDIVTVMEFHPDRPHMFFSGSDDGLIAAFDFSQSFNEDDFIVRSFLFGRGLLLHQFCECCTQTVPSIAGELVPRLGTPQQDHSCNN